MAEGLPRKYLPGDEARHGFLLVEKFYQAPFRFWPAVIWKFHV